MTAKNFAALDDVVGAWNKMAGPRPTLKELDASSTTHKVGTKKWVAIAMYLRKGGATQKQITAVLEKPQLNCWRDLQASPNWDADQSKKGKHFSYFLRLVGKPDK